MKVIFEAKNNTEEECSIFIIEHLSLLSEKPLLKKILENGNEKRKLYALLTLIKLGEHNLIKTLLEKMLSYEKENKRELLELILTKYRSFSAKAKKLVLQQMHNAQELDKLTYYIIFSHSHYIFRNELDELRW